MPRTSFLFVFSFVLCGFVCTACARNPEIIDPAEAAKDPDFKIQGEYLSEGNAPIKSANEQFKAEASDCLGRREVLRRALQRGIAGRRLEARR